MRLIHHMYGIRRQLQLSSLQLRKTNTTQILNSHQYYHQYYHPASSSSSSSSSSIPSQFQLRWKTSSTNSSTSTSTKRDEPTMNVMKRRLDVAIVGAPNAGKSQFLNTVTSTTISAVSRKRHTTRSGILATHTSKITNTNTSNNKNTNTNTNNSTKTQTQIVFIDTPGFVQYNNAKDTTLYEELVKGATSSMDRADYTIIIIDAAKMISNTLMEELTVLMLAAQYSRGRIEDVRIGIDGELEEVVVDDDNDDNDDNNINDDGNKKKIKRRQKFAIVLNKVDLVNPKEKLLQIAHDIGTLGDACVRYRGEIHDENGELLNINVMQDGNLSTNGNGSIVGDDNGNDNNNSNDNNKEELVIDDEEYPPIFFISALKNDGLEDVINHLYTLSTPTKNFVLPPNQKTSLTLIERIEELIREKLYRCLHREVPHSIQQVNRVLKSGTLRDGRKVLRIDQDIVVRTKSHHKLVLGRGGMTLKRIEETARRDLLRVLGPDEGYDDILLNLHVKYSKSKQYERNLEAEREGVMRKIY